MQQREKGERERRKTGKETKNTYRGSLAYFFFTHFRRVLELTTTTKREYRECLYTPHSVSPIINIL